MSQNREMRQKIERHNSRHMLHRLFPLGQSKPAPSNPQPDKSQCSVCRLLRFVWPTIFIRDSVDKDGRKIRLFGGGWLWKNLEYWNKNNNNCVLSSCMLQHTDHYRCVRRFATLHAAQKIVQVLAAVLQKLIEANDNVRLRCNRRE